MLAPSLTPRATSHLIIFPNPLKTPRQVQVLRRVGGLAENPVAHCSGKHLRKEKMWERLSAQGTYMWRDAHRELLLCTLWGSWGRWRHVESLWLQAKHLHSPSPRGNWFTADSPRGRRKGGHGKSGEISLCLQPVTLTKYLKVVFHFVLLFLIALEVPCPSLSPRHLPSLQNKHGEVGQTPCWARSAKESQSLWDHGKTWEDESPWEGSPFHSWDDIHVYTDVFSCVSSSGIKAPLEKFCVDDSSMRE